MKIAILGRKNQTTNYENFVKLMPAVPKTSLEPEIIYECDALVLPGGGDITPAFFGEHNDGSGNIDTELDILQLQAFRFCLGQKKPILGICKGMQLINVALGGTIVQHLKNAKSHYSGEGDLYHSTQILEGTCLYELYGRHAVVNSAHHQSVGKLGKGLSPIQWCEDDGCVEAVIHENLPILGLQWHPERLFSPQSPTAGEKILSLFYSWIQSGVLFR